MQFPISYMCISQVHHTGNVPFLQINSLGNDERLFKVLSLPIDMANGVASGGGERGHSKYRLPQRGPITFHQYSKYTARPQMNLNVYSTMNQCSAR